ncbi:MAG: DNA translocase FtsK 4TM domain-containing protein [Deltaproteobacteria bacterium]|nr:DNA translocase FtsK 4TM domain-containing protein [Deltaproteobacteria bacterium]
MARAGKAGKGKKAAAKSGKPASSSSGNRFLRPVAGIVLLGGAMVSLLGLVSYVPKASQENLAGPLGHALAATLLEAFGFGAYTLALFLLLGAFALVAGFPKLTIGRSLSWALVCAGTMALCALLVKMRLQGHLPGGVIGAVFAGALKTWLSTAGAAVLLLALTMAALVVATDLWALRAAAAAGRLSVAGGALAWKGATAAVTAARRREDSDEDSDEEYEDDDDDERDRSDDPTDPPIVTASKETKKRAQALALASADAPPEDPREPVARKPKKDPVPLAPIVVPLAAEKDKPKLAEVPGPAAPPAAPPIAVPPGMEKAAKDKGGKASGELKVDAKTEPKHEPQVVPPIVPGATAKPASDKLTKSGTAAANAATNGAATNAAAMTGATALSSASMSANATGAATVAGAEAAAPMIVEPKPVPKPLKAELIKPEVTPVAEAAKKDFIMAEGHATFETPPIDILTGEASAAAPLDRAGLTSTAEKLRMKLQSFGIEGQVTQIRPGPVVTMFEFLPAAGVKVSRIASLSDDLAMAMEAMRVRIIAPIPGKGVVGIEIPNKSRQTVVLKELVEQEAFQKSPSKLAMCLGKDVEGMPYIADLAKMPHLLIAGTTGSGKSVAVNSMIVSMLLRASPEDVRFLMVDPKMLELSVYEGIPHLLLPVVTDSKKAAMALRWGVEEMERRYQLLAECGVRNITSYNKKVEKEGEGARRPQPKAVKEKRVVDLSDPNLDIHELNAAAARGEVTSSGAATVNVGQSMKSSYLADGPAAQHGGKGAMANGAGTSADSTAEWLQKEMQARGEKIDIAGKQLELPIEPLKKLPYLVIIIDELADLMMVASREVETYIARLAQMARAAGIHLMVATQRPSTDVVTGVIKANFPARISFQVASRHDSATIINTPGAENLLGMGDMLILPPGTSSLTRVHGPYVDEKEIHAVVEHWKAQGSPVYDANILKPRAEDGEEGAVVEDEGPDELYDQALASLADMRFISI